MIRDITIGQYYPAESRIHRLDPRVKIVCTLLFLVSLFIQNSLLGYVIATVFLGAVIRLSKVPLKYIVKGLKPIVILLLFTVVMNLFLTQGGQRLVHFWIFTITENGTAYFCVYGCETDVPGGGVIDHDIHDFAQWSDRWNGEAAPSSE